MPLRRFHNGRRHFDCDRGPKRNQVIQGIASKHNRPRADARFIIGQRIDKCDYLIVESLYCLHYLAGLPLLSLTPIVRFKSPFEFMVTFLVLHVGW